MPGQDRYDIVVIGGGHAGAEAAWAAANLGVRVALLTMDPQRIGAMSCNPAIGGLAKGQMVREIDALGGLMALATDATAIQFRMLNASKGAAVHGPRAQCDKHRYAREVARLLHTRPNLTIVAGLAEDLLVHEGRMAGVVVKPACLEADSPLPQPSSMILHVSAVILTTGTFMRGLMHTGERRTPGGRVGEGAAQAISAALSNLGLELGRLKTGTPPRLDAQSIDFSALEPQPGDDPPQPFSDLTATAIGDYSPALNRFPVLPQRDCHLTQTNPAIHQAIRDNLHRAPMYNGQIQTTGPRYCPSIEDKVMRFADRPSHHVYLEPESLDTDEIYCNGISTSLPIDVQEFIVSHMPGCREARILRPGYAVEYDMVWPHQIDVTCMAKLPHAQGLFLAGQINGTSGYEEAAGQGLLAGLNAVRYLRGQPLVRLRRDQAYLGVMMDDLVTKVPREPYRMFTSRAEHRLLLRADNADHRLTPLGREWGLVDDGRWRIYQARLAALNALRQRMNSLRVEGKPLLDWARRPEVDASALLSRLDLDAPWWSQARAGLPPKADLGPQALPLVSRLLADIQYEGYIARQSREVEKLVQLEGAAIAPDFDYDRVSGLRRETRQALEKFRPTTLGQAGRLAGVTPADVMLLSVAMGRG